MRSTFCLLLACAFFAMACGSSGSGNGNGKSTCADVQNHVIACAEALGGTASSTIDCGSGPIAANQSASACTAYNCDQIAINCMMTTSCTGATTFDQFQNAFCSCTQTCGQ